MHHLMLGTTLRDDSFINVIYQKNLDVLDPPFHIRPDVRIPVGAYNMRRVDVHLQHQPGAAALSAGHVAADRVLRRHATQPCPYAGRRPRHQPAVERSCSTTATT